MDFFNSFLKRYWSVILNGILLVLLALTTGYFLLEKEEPMEDTPVALVSEEAVAGKVFVDLKGAVKNPGVYEMESSSIINDVITKAGGFTSKAYKNNLNLSKRISDEMVIYVYTKTEYNNLNKEVTETTNCNCESADISSCVNSGSSVIIADDSVSSDLNQTDNSKQEEISSKVSLNKATKEELMTLNGVGESKAESIIKYRNENGGFKTIEEVKNISGIGDAAYEKIKDYITL